MGLTKKMKARQKKMREMFPYSCMEFVHSSSGIPVSFCTKPKGHDNPCKGVFVTDQLPTKEMKS